MGKTLLTLFVFGMVFGLAQSVSAQDHECFKLRKTQESKTTLPAVEKHLNGFAEKTPEQLVVWEDACQTYNLAIRAKETITGPRSSVGQLLAPLRERASKVPLFAFKFAIYIDKQPNPTTLYAVCNYDKSKTFCEAYKAFFQFGH